MKIYKPNPIDTFVILKDIYYTFQMYFGNNFGRFMFKMGDSLCEIIVVFKEYYNQRRIQNPVKHLRWSVLRKCYILDI